jgi:serine/threonine protein kinase
MEEFGSSIPGYEILGELGRGGMGIVFKAHNLRYNRPVALKMILSGHGANLLELARFRIEAEAIASLAHPNIVRIHEVGVHLGYPFFVSSSSNMPKEAALREDPNASHASRLDPSRYPATCTRDAARP